MNQTADLCILEHRRDPERPRPAVDGLYLCHGHHAELERLVAEMPMRYNDLDRALVAVGPKVGTSSSPGLTVDEVAAELRMHMVGVVASWCRVVAEDRGIRTPAGPELTRTAPWLIRHIDWCAANRWVDEMLLELRKVTGCAIGLTDIPARQIRLGEQCRTHVEGERCEGIITIVIRGDDWIARCRTCLIDQDAIPYLRAVRAGQWVTQEEVIHLADVYDIACSPDVVRQWKHRRRIKGRDDGRQAWYDLASVHRYLTHRRAERERIAS